MESEFLVIQLHFVADEDSANLPHVAHPQRARGVGWSHVVVGLI